MIMLWPTLLALQLCSFTNDFVWIVFVRKHFLHMSLCLDSLRMKTEDGDVLLDYSKNLITDEVMKMLFDLVNPSFSPAALEMPNVSIADPGSFEESNPIRI